MSYLISVLDKSPVADGSISEQALRNSVLLAQQAERLGCHHYWFAEHHATPQLASAAPEVLAAWVLAQTRHIRIGGGGVMLRHYAPYKVAEAFNLLAALAPGRVDLGVGKAPGGLPASTRALAAGRPAFTDFDQQLRDLDGYLSRRPGEHADAFSEAHARPLLQTAPERFLLGASPQSAQLAAELGWRFVYAAHFDGDPRHIDAAFTAYAQHSSQVPLLATAAFAAPTAEAAARHVGALRVYKLHLAPGQTVNLPTPEAAAEYARQVGVHDARIEETRPSVLSGDAAYVRAALDDLHRRHGVGEFILDAPVADLDARLASLELLSPAPRAAVA
ncbi:MAG: Limonene 1,2-monooxygenase [Stenotrophomonas maltophilia]|uniref:Limonene 1,2-monooxygenase n=1 Tax=Stenotrophomonas maltophilia TaxID=40324 RepID=A0A7V8FJY1_STEMA|nr:MAG: Limonene 1,2-monooxygenase [Stenotrophomonas maltophilia]